MMEEQPNPSVRDQSLHCSGDVKTGAVTSLQSGDIPPPPRCGDVPALSEVPAAGKKGRILQSLLSRQLNE